MTGQFHSYLNPKCDSGEFEEKGGCGVFAREPIRMGELICLWGGRIVAENELDPTMQFFTQRILQIEEGFYLEAPLPLEPSDCFNHSCEPNVGFSGQIGLVAMRNIEAGEELNFDYAMCDGSNYDEFDCYCGSEKYARHVPNSRPPSHPAAEAEIIFLKQDMSVGRAVHPAKCLVPDGRQKNVRNLSH